MISFLQSGDFKKTEKFLEFMTRLNIPAVLHAAGREGVVALSNATPVDTGLAANSWSYEVTSSGNVYTISWINTDIEGGFNVVLALQYGHGTGTGGYVKGRDFINPAMKPVFDRIAERVWKAVTSA